MLMWLVLMVLMPVSSSRTPAEWRGCVSRTWIATGGLRQSLGTAWSPTVGFARPRSHRTAIAQSHADRSHCVLAHRNRIASCNR
jgi:hypothetical protein